MFCNRLMLFSNVSVKLILPCFRSLSAVCFHSSLPCVICKIGIIRFPHFKAYLTSIKKYLERTCGNYNVQFSGINIKIGTSLISYLKWKFNYP